MATDIFQVFFILSLHLSCFVAFQETLWKEKLELQPSSKAWYFQWWRKIMCDWEGNFSQFCDSANFWMKFFKETDFFCSVIPNWIQNFDAFEFVWQCFSSEHWHWLSASACTVKHLPRIFGRVHFFPVFVFFFLFPVVFNSVKHFSAWNWLIILLAKNKSLVSAVWNGTSEEWWAGFESECTNRIDNGAVYISTSHHLGS